MSRDILYRLINKGMVVGYQQQKNGIIYHGDTPTSGNSIQNMRTTTSPGLTKVFLPHYIEHDSIDAYTGVDIDGVKVFERDEFITENNYTGIVLFKHGKFLAIMPAVLTGLISEDLSYAVEMGIRVTGIKGVK